MKLCDPLPPYNGKLRLYNMRFCPFAERAVLVLNAKNIDYEIVNIDLVDKPEWYASKSALTRVPTLEIEDGVTIFESLVISQYLEEAYPEVPMLPKDPVQKASDKLIVDIMSEQIHPLLMKVIGAPEKVTDAAPAYFKVLDFMQTQLQKRGTKFFGGNIPGYVDYMVWPWFERLDVMQNENIKLDEKKYKVMLKYLKNMSEDPVVVEYSIPRDINKQCLDDYGSGKKPNYDALLEE